MSSGNKRDARKLESLQKSQQKYYALAALLETWEKNRNADPEYVKALSKRVQAARNQLTVKIGMKP